MKPHLPRSLSLALAACFAMLPGYTLATTNLADIAWDNDDYGFYAEVVGDIEVSSDVDMTNKTLVWGRKDGTSAPVTMSGKGTIRSECPVIDGCTCGYLDVDLSGGHGIIESGIIFDGVDLSVRNGVELEFKGTLKGSDSDSTYINIADITLDLTDATIINGEGELCFEAWGGSAILRIPEFEVSAKRSLSIQGIESESPVTLDGDLTLNANSAILPYEGHLDFKISHDEGAAFPTLAVTGTLSIVSTTTVSFSSSAYNAEEKNNYYIPSGDIVIMRVGDLSGDLRNLVAYSLLTVFDSEISSDPYSDPYYAPPMRLDDKMFTSRPAGDGYEILLVNAPSQKPETPPAISSGEATGALGETQRIDFGTAGGTVDATGVTGGLNSDNVQGQSGTLVTSSEQTMQLSGLAVIGYNITGVSDAAGAALEMDGTLAILEGETYQVQSVSINKGILEVSEGTQLTTADSSGEGIQLKADTVLNNYGTITADVTLETGAKVDNRGNIEGDVTLSGEKTIFANNSEVTGDTTVSNGALVKGNGTFIGDTIFSDATMHIGNSPGRMTYTGNTTLDNATLEFTLSGLRASQGANDTEGTYSTVVFTGGELTVQNDLTLKLEVEDNFIAALMSNGNAPITLQLIDITGVTNTGAALTNLQNALSQATTVVTGNLNEVLQGLNINTNGELTATVNQGLLAALVSDNGSDLANTMWSSARTLESFAATSKAQLAQVPAGKTHAWVSALGSHVDIGGARGFRYNGGGAVVGIARGFDGGLSAGLSLGQSKGTFKSDGGKVRDEQETTMLGLYGQYLWQTSATRHTLTVYAAYGCSDNDADTQMAGTPARASWDDEALHLGTQYSADIALSDSLSFTPFLSLEYTRVSQDDITERSGALAAHYSDGSMENLSIAPGVTLRKSIALGTTQRLLPELTLAYVGDVVRDNPSLNRQAGGYRAHATGSKVGRHALMLRAGSYWALNEQVTLDAFYTLETREHECSQGANLGVSIDF